MKKHSLCVFVVIVVVAVLLGWFEIKRAGIVQSAAHNTMLASSVLAEEVYIPAGPFAMGCAQDFTSYHCDVDATPIHLVYLDAFFIDKLQVTNAQYVACVAAGVCPAPLSYASATRPDYYTNPQYRQHPVLNVPWEYANAYCQWVGKRLPTEAEWEKAARGTDLRPFSWGFEEPTCELGNVSVMLPGEEWHRTCVGDTVAVGSYPRDASPYGVLDMTGNARDFVNDFYDTGYYNRSPYYNPQGPATNLGKDYIARGGDWYAHPRLATTWVRHDEASALVYKHISFRCARDAPVAPTPTPPPTPTPTPVPSDSGRIGAEGGLLWIAYPEHLTAVRVPTGILTGPHTLEIAPTLTYTQPRPVGNLHGMNHFFIVGGVPPATPLEVLLGFKHSGGVLAGTEDLYRLDAAVWVTSSITTTDRGSGYIRAWIDQPGIYGILGQTNRTYLPLVFRR